MEGSERRKKRERDREREGVGAGKGSTHALVDLSIYACSVLDDTSIIVSLTLEGKVNGKCAIA